MVDYNPHTNQGANGGGLIRISSPDAPPCLHRTLLDFKCPQQISYTRMSAFKLSAIVTSADYLFLFML